MDDAPSSVAEHSRLWQSVLRDHGALIRVYGAIRTAFLNVAIRAKRMQSGNGNLMERHAVGALVLRARLSL